MLFADLSGFEALTSSLDPEELLELLDPLLESMTATMERHGGYVEKYAGDAVLALFGAPVAHEDDAARAVRCAAELHRLVAGYQRGSLLGEPRLHVGIESGEVLVRTLGRGAHRDYAALGDAVVLAQRLQAAAPAGQTYVGAAVAGELVGRVDLEPVGTVATKGRHDGLQAWRTAGRLPPEPVAAAVRVLGREAERQQLSQAVERLRTGTGGLVVLRGEAGAGKSSLLRSLVDAPEGVAVCVVQFRPVQLRPYEALLDLLLGVLDLPPAGEVTDQQLRAALVAAGVEASTGVVAAALGLPGAVPPDPASAGLLVAEALVASVRRRLLAEPVMVVCEDLHNADPASLGVLRLLAASVSPAPLMLAITTRDLTGEVLRPDPDLDVELGALPEGALRELATDLLGMPCSPQLARWLLQRTGGNPFFAAELLRAAAENNTVRAGSFGAELHDPARAGSVPHGIHGVVAARIDALSPNAQQVVAWCSVAGDGVPRELLDSSVTVGGLDLADGLSELVAAGFLLHVYPLVRFRHVIARDVVYRRVLRRDAAPLHRAIAVAAETAVSVEFVRDSVVGRHWAAAGEGAKALAPLLRAADRAYRVADSADAYDLLDTASSVIGPDDPARPAIDVRRAALLELAGDYAPALELYRRAAADGRLGLAVAGTVSVLRKLGRYAEALATADTLSETEDARAAGVVELERGRALLGAGRFVEARLAFRTSVDTLRDHPRGGEALVQLARTELAAGEVEAALAHAVEGRDRLVAMHETRGQVIASRVLGGVYQDLGQLDVAAAELRGGVELADRIGDVEESGGCLINLALVEVARGQVATAVACDRRAAQEFERIGHLPGVCVARANLAEHLLLAGDLVAAAIEASAALELADRINDGLTSADATMTLGAVEIAAGRPVAGAELAATAGRAFTELGAAPGAAQAFRLEQRAWAAAGRPEAADDAGRRAETAVASAELLSG
jgi:class 3 adenylate cyclase/tetratricopeptide (TPR) repeat protein